MPEPTSNADGAGVGPSDGAPRSDDRAGPGEPTEQPGADAEQPRRVIPSWTDPVARSASTAFGGPWGRHGAIGRAWFFTPLRVMLGLAVLTLALAWVKAEPCADGAWLPGHTQFTHFCYSDSIPLYLMHGLDQGAVPYLDAQPGLTEADPDYHIGRVEYPVMSGAFMYGAARLAAVYQDLADQFPGVLPQTNDVESYFVVTCLLLSLCALVIVWATARSSGIRPWDGALVAISPLLVVHAFTNWDLFAVALASAAVLAWARKRSVLAGVLLGLATAAKLYPLLFLGPMLVLALRSGRWRSMLAAAAAAGVTWAAVNVPVAVFGYDGWSLFFSLNESRPADYDSLWQLGERIVSGAPQFEFFAVFDNTVLNTLVAISFAITCLGIGWLTLAAPRRPRLAQLLFLVVAAFLLTNKVWSPQYSLWLLPLAALARPRWPMLIVWQVAEAGVWITRMLWLLARDQTQAGENVRGVDYPWFAGALVIRDALVITLMVLVIREILRPGLDVVRRFAVDDPAGGVFDRAPDRIPGWLGWLGPGRRAPVETPRPTVASAVPIGSTGPPGSSGHHPSG